MILHGITCLTWHCALGHTPAVCEVLLRELQIGKENIRDVFKLYKLLEPSGVLVEEFTDRLSISGYQVVAFQCPNLFLSTPLPLSRSTYWYYMTLD